MGLPEVLLKAYEERVVYTDQGQKIPLRASVSKAEAELLYNICQEIKPQSSLELGFGSGMSTLAILKSLEDNQQGHHYVIDYLEKWFENSGLAMVERANLSHRLSFYPEQLEDVFQKLPPLDFAFIDASHLFDLTIFAFVLIDKKLKTGGLIGFHDAWLPSQRQTLTYILTNRAYTLHNPRPRSLRNRIMSTILSLLPYQMPRKLPLHLRNRYAKLGLPNLALLQKQAGDTRNWDYHVEF